MAGASTSHLVLIPSYNTGPRLAETVAAALAMWRPVWVVIDGSTDESDALPQQDGLSVLRLPRNGGKGAAVLAGALAARAGGFSHVLCLDADGQHAAADIPAMMTVSAAQPGAAILGVPVFAADAPALRVVGRRVSNILAGVLAPGIGDSLFGFRVYPVSALLAAFEATRFMRRFDFDPEVAVRLAWRGVALVNRPSRVRYFSAAEGGVSHFRYVRDNALLGFMYVRLFAERLSKGRQGLFFEKKKQKTFMNRSFLVLFCKKGLLAN